MYVCKQYIVRCMEGWPFPTLCASCDGENNIIYTITSHLRCFVVHHYEPGDNISISLRNILAPVLFYCNPSYHYL